MTAYVIFIRDETVDQDEMQIYSEKASAAHGDHPMTPLAFYGPAEALEGPGTEGVVLLKFPDMDAAKAWYFSPAYQQAKQHRLKGAKYRVVLTEGIA
ncbi:DUF1330 domain-containing protein [Tatumella sp. UBA2305]|uniref:DUF1330 domain-containing protein n=1 Tax=Tatumella sp. UBA2305 TaxID=1947647 RepID=UPI0025E3D135|nr:DUF1330 domain-containing protein [Tatumella sp. UBA2305]